MCGGRVLIFKYVLMYAGSFKIPANYINESIANMQASVFTLGIFHICVKGESAVTLESYGSLVEIPGCFEDASLH